MAEAVGLEPTNAGIKTQCVSISPCSIIIFGGGRCRGMECNLHLLNFTTKEKCFKSAYIGWCPKRESNPHDICRWNLNPMCIPIPPFGHIIFYKHHPTTLMLSAHSLRVLCASHKFSKESNLKYCCTTNIHFNSSF